MTFSLRTCVRVVLTTLLLSVIYLDYWDYSKLYQTEPDAYMDIVRGAATAPMQYRVLVIDTANFLHMHAHLGMRHAFALIDAIAALVAGFVLLTLLERSAAFTRAGAVLRAAYYASFLFLMAYFLVWLTWFQRPETLTTAALVAVMLMLMSLRPTTSAQYAGIAIATVLLSATQGFVRADVSFCVYAGLALAALLPLGKSLPQAKSFVLPLAVVAALVAGSMQWVMMHKVYPHANYGTTKVFQLFMNMEPFSIAAFVLFMAPLALAVIAILRTKPQIDAHFLALLLGAAIFLPLWMVAGRIQEVRIFLPFALALSPLAAIAAGSLLPKDPAYS